MSYQFSVYALQTGMLTGAVITASSMETMDVVLNASVPDGCGVVLGWWDHTCHAVDLSTGEVVEIEPPPPDWQERKGIAASTAYAEIVAAESLQSRPLREIVDSLITGSAPPSEALAQFSEIKSRIDAARTRYRAILNAQTSDELDSLGL